jgi:hypothetical protein
MIVYWWRIISSDIYQTGTPLTDTKSAWACDFIWEDLGKARGVTRYLFSSSNFFLAMPAHVYESRRLVGSLIIS